MNEDPPSTLWAAPASNAGAPAAAAQPLPETLRVATRLYLGVFAGSCLALALLLLIDPGTQTRAPLQPALCGLLAVLALAAMRQPAARIGPAAAGLAVLAALVTGLAAHKLGWSYAAPAFGLLALNAGLVTGLAGLGAGLVAGAGAGVVALLLVHAPDVPSGALPLALALLLLLLLAVSQGAGWFAARLLRQYVHAADERERRFRGLLRIAVDTYWELDSQHRIVALTRQSAGARAPGPEDGIGAVPWEHAAFGCEPEALDRLLADVEARQPFRDVLARWTTRRGVRQVLVSGEPRFDRRGSYTGYWGVTRDITDDMRTRATLAFTESRYRDLFACIPTAIVVHRDHLVIDANPAAVALFGQASIDSMLGMDLLSAFADDDSRDRAIARRRELKAMAPGEPLPVAEFRITGRGGRPFVVRASGVTVQTEQGPALLSIFVDDTERQAAEQAVRRSEALLSHLVASSPDLIAVLDIHGDRLVMVNQTFERLLGWSADEACGRRADELDLWARPAERQAFGEALRRDSRIERMAVGFRHRDRTTTVPVIVSAARFRMERREYVVINGRDLTEVEHHRLEREAILDNASIGIVLTRENTVQVANPAASAMFGWRQDELVGQPTSTLWPDATPWAEIGQRHEPALARGEQIEIETDGRRKDGTVFPCRALARAIDPSHPGRGSTIWIIEDITERRRTDAALARARDDAEAASRAKSAFLANTSHELRTPLNGLLGMAQLARAPGLDPERRGQYLEHIVESAKSLAAIVADILDLSKIEAGKLDLESQVFDLQALLASVRRGYATLAAGQGLALELELEIEAGAAVHGVRGDPLRVRQIVTNYVTNAIKFTRRGAVRIRARRLTDGKVRLEVHDTGPGIDAATLARLFRPFTQADVSTTRRFGGTGLGLSICRELAQLMGGRVGADSQPGQGSCFWAELPLPAGSVAAASAAPDDPAVLRGARVLVVDDNEVNRLVASAQLEQFGVCVVQADGGHQALQAVAEAQAAGEPFDLLLLDLQMPDLSGYEVTRELRRSFDAAALPIVAYTAAVLVSEREAALAAGINDFLPKPTEVDRLQATVARWLRLPASSEAER